MSEKNEAGRKKNLILSDFNKLKINLLCKHIPEPSQAVNNERKMREKK
jgi:hypothetical protein